LEEIGKQIFKIVSKESLAQVKQHETLEICVGARVMLLKNLATGMGPLNGSQGIIEDIVFDKDENVEMIIVKFDTYTGPSFYQG